MQHLDVCRNADVNMAGRVPFLLVVQADVLASLATRVVVPLIDRATLPGTPIRGLMPTFTVEGRVVVASIPELAGVAAGVLGPKVTSLRDHRDVIVAALDLLFTEA